MKTLAVLLSLVFATAIMRADITTTANAADRKPGFGSRVSTHFAYDYAQRLVGDFSRFESNGKINRFAPSVSIMITVTSRKNYEGRPLDTSEFGIMPRSVPEAGTLGLMGIGLLGIAMVARRRITFRVTDVQKSSS